MNDADKTLSSPWSALADQSAPLLCLTLLWHPELDRVGQQYLDATTTGCTELNRFLPLFQHAGEPGIGLAHRCIARSPLRLQRHPDGSVALTAPDSSMAVEVNGQRLSVPVAHLSREQVARGVVLRLGGHVLLCLHWMHGLPKLNALPGVLGVSSAAIVLRDQIRQVARTDLPVLLQGETGSGKDVAARAIHAASDRKQRPFVAVNMAALSESLAAAELFGAARGAYTGAAEARPGLFAEAADGTLFLDEIGDTPPVVQPMLLRVLENGEYRPLGARHNQQSQARVISATDQDLDGRGFNQALLRRMEAYAIRVPALRERREDIGVLLRHLQRQWMQQSGQAVELPAALVNELCCYDWPGNIRQLAHVVRRAMLALAAGDAPRLAQLLPSAMTPPAAPALSSEAPAAALVDAPAASPKAPRVRLDAVDAQSVVDAMEHNGWHIQRAARALGISRPSLYKLLESNPQIRRAESIPMEEIRRALAQHATDWRKCASELRTPGEALRRYLRQIGLLA